MVGGKIIEIRHEPGKVRLWCVDGTDECAIYVEDVPAECQPGDSLWWQGRQAFWTPQDKHVIEQPLVRVGFSFDPRPKPE